MFVQVILTDYKPDEMGDDDPDYRSGEAEPANEKIAIDDTEQGHHSNDRKIERGLAARVHDRSELLDECRKNTIDQHQPDNERRLGEFLTRQDDQDQLGEEEDEDAGR